MDMAALNFYKINFNSGENFYIKDDTNRYKTVL